MMRAARQLNEVPRTRPRSIVAILANRMQRTEWCMTCVILPETLVASADHITGGSACAGRRSATAS